MPSFLRLPVLLLVLLTGSCSQGGSPDPTPDPSSGDEPRARIENRASLDMDIHLLRSDGQRIRLGFVPGDETATFALPSTITVGATSIRFQAVPVRRSGEPVVSELFGIGRREEITWSIPPQ